MPEQYVIYALNETGQTVATTIRATSADQAKLFHHVAHPKWKITRVV